MFERWLTWYLGVNVPREPGTHLHFQWIWENPFQPWPVELIWLVLGVGCGLLIWMWRWTMSEDRHRQLRVLMVRLVLWVLLMFLILQVSLRIGVMGRPVILVLADVSESMLLEDEYNEAAEQKLQQLLASQGNQSTVDGKQASRLEIARAVLLQQEGQWLRELQEKTQVQMLPFTDTLELSERDTNEEHDLPQQIRNLHSQPGMTNLRDAVEGALDDSRSEPPAAVIVLTDGNATSNPRDSLLMAAREQARRKVPLYVVGLGASTTVRDVRISKVTTDRLAFPGDAIHVDVQLEGDGILSETVRVQLIDRATGEELNSEEVTFSGQRNKTAQAAVSLEHRAEVVGLLDLEVRCSRIPGEGQLDNNEARTRVWVRSGAIQVLLIERQPRWEYRHLKWTLERDPSVILKTWLDAGDLETAVEDRTVLTRLPETLEEWLAYDVVIWGDMDPKAAHVNLSQLEAFVSEHGGGLMLLPGRNSAKDWKKLLDLSPVHQFDEHDIAGPLAVGLTPDGRGTRFLQMAGHENAGAVRLPPLMRSRYDVELRTGATVLMEGLPHRQSPVPLLVEHHFGAGQVLLQLLDETWRWRPISEGEVYRRYWSELIRHLGKRKLDSTQPEFDLFVDRTEYELNSPVTITLYTRAAANTRTLELQEPDGGKRTISLASSSEPLKFTAQLEGLAPGSYSAHVSDTLSLESPPVSWKVSDRDPERTYRPLNLADLTEAARISGGKFYQPWETSRLPAELPASKAAANQQFTVIAIWARWEVLLLCVGLLAIDWYWRR